MNLVETKQADLRLRLQNELIQRSKKNRKYSLRAFARFLSIEPSALSKILKGKRNISGLYQEKISQRLGWIPLHPDYTDLDLELFQLICNWYHFAILELTSTKNFKGNSKWIATELGISVPEVDQAVERLKALGFLSISKSGKWRDESGSLTTIHNVYTHAAFRQLQKQILTQAQEALETLPFEIRDQTAMTMAIDSEKLPAAREKIKNFRRELCAFLQSGRKDSVFQLSIALFPVTKNISIEKSKEKSS